MTAPYTRRFAARFSTAGGTESVFTASDAFVWIIRDVFIANSTGTAGRSQLYLQAGQSVFFLFDGTLESIKQVHLELRQEILPSEQLIWSAPAPTWSLLVTGYALHSP